MNKSKSTNLDETFQRISFDVIQFGAEQQTRSSTQFPIGFIDQIGQNQFFKVDEGLGHGEQVDAIVQFVDASHFTFQTTQFTQRQLNVRKPFAELVVQFFLQIRRFHIINYGRDVGGEC